MQLRPDDRALLEKIAALADAEAPKRARNVHEHMARKVGAASSAELKDKRGLPLAALRRLEARGLLRFGSISGDCRWHDTMEQLAGRYSISVEWLVRRIGFVVRPSPAGWKVVNAADAGGDWITAEDAVDRRLVSGKGQLTKLANKHPLLRRQATDADRQCLGRPKLMYVYNASELQKLA